MKILYAIQGTGNGHVSRAREIIPLLKNFGEVDVLISGTHSEVSLGHEIKYRFQGFGFVFGKNGSVDFKETWRRFNVLRFIKDIRQLPVKDYDLVLNDFEPVCAWSCKLKGKKSIGISHQSAYLSRRTPQLKGFHWGKWIMNNYAPASKHYAFHFERFDDFIYTPVIRSEIRALKPENKGHYTVYLPAYGDDKILKLVNAIPNSYWHIFSKHNDKNDQSGNAKILPIENETFIESLRTCKGLLTGGGFEGPAEALFLGKKLLVVPMHHQYEQQCNALALEKMGLPVIWNEKEFNLKLQKWVKNDEIVSFNFPDETLQILKEIVDSEI